MRTRSRDAALLSSRLTRERGYPHPAGTSRACNTSRLDRKHAATLAGGASADRDQGPSPVGPWWSDMFEFGLIVIAVILIPALVILSLITLILVEQD